METTYFQGNSEHPQHISVGAVLRNDKGEVCVHHFLAENLKGYWVEEKLDDFYVLMRETLETNESLESALHRGLKEEFGATARMLDYIGSLRSHFEHKGVEVEKTTLYFLCELVSQDTNLRLKDDIEGTTELEWHKPEFLIPLMKEQAKKFKRTDVDESEILERTIKNR